MKLYYAPLSTYSQKVMMAFHEVGLEYEPEIVNLMDEREHAKYREMYPIGKVPLLVLDDGHKIPESSIIIEYLNGLKPEAGLIPDDPEQGRQTRFYDRMYDLYFNNNVGTVFFENLKPEDQRRQDVIDQAMEKINVMYGFMENRFGSSKWATGDNFSMADCAAAPPLFYAQNIASFADKPNINAYWQRLSERPSYQRVAEHAKPFLETFMSRAA